MANRALHHGSILASEFSRHSQGGTGAACGRGASRFGWKCRGGNGGVDGEVPGGGAINHQVTDLINFVPGGFFLFFLFPKNQRKQNIFLIK